MEQTRKWRKGTMKKREQKSDIYRKRKGENSSQFSHARLRNKFYKYKWVK